MPTFMLIFKVRRDYLSFINFRMYSRMVANYFFIKLLAMHSKICDIPHSKISWPAFYFHCNLLKQKLLWKIGSLELWKSVKDTRCLKRPISFSLGIIHQDSVIGIGWVLRFKHYWMEIGKNFWYISTNNSILTLRSRTNCWTASIFF